MNRWNESLKALRRDIELEHEAEAAIAIMDSYAELYEHEEKPEYRTPCDYPDNDGHFHCPYDAQGGDDCRRFCGLGVDE